jgi:hypothetical protein
MHLQQQIASIVQQRPPTSTTCMALMMLCMDFSWVGRAADAIMTAFRNFPVCEWLLATLPCAEQPPDCLAQFDCIAPLPWSPFPHKLFLLHRYVSALVSAAVRSALDSSMLLSWQALWAAWCTVYPCCVFLSHFRQVLSLSNGLSQACMVHLYSTQQKISHVHSRVQFSHSATVLQLSSHSSCRKALAAIDVFKACKQDRPGVEALLDGMSDFNLKLTAFDVACTSNLCAVARMEVWIRG